MTEIDVAREVLLTIVAFVAATLAAVTGFGGAALLLPVLTLVYGVRDAIPILTVAQLVGNGSRAWFNRHEVDRAVVRWYSVGAVPLALLGGYLFAVAPAGFLTRVLGLFLIAVVIWRHARRNAFPKPTLHGFAFIGAASSFLSALVGSVGPLMAPLFLAYGLVKGAYIGTEALATVITHTVKLVAYGQAAALSRDATIAGLALGPVMVAGSFLGKRIVDRLPQHVFVALIEGTMIVAGAVFAIRG